MVLDFFFIFTLLFSAYNGYYKGFSRILLSFVVFIVSIILSLTAFSYVNDIFMETSFGKEMYSNILNSVEYEIEKTEDASIENIPYLSSFYKSKDGESILKFSEFSSSIAEKTIKSIISIPIIIIIFLLIKICTSFFAKLAKKTVSLPIISTADSLLGLFCGIFTGVVILAVAYSILSFLQFVPQLHKLKFQFDTSAFVLLINDYIF